MAYIASEFNIVGADSGLVMDQLRHSQTMLRTEQTEQLKQSFISGSHRVGERIMALMPGTECDFRHHITDGVKVFEIEIGVSRWEEGPHGYFVALKDVTELRPHLLDLQSTSPDPDGRAALVLMAARKAAGAGVAGDSGIAAGDGLPPSFDHNCDISRIDFKEIVIDGRREHGSLTLILRRSEPDGGSTSHTIYAVPGQIGASFNSTIDRDRNITRQVGPHAVTVKDMEVACGCAKFVLPWVEMFIEQGLLAERARVITP